MMNTNMYYNNFMTPPNTGISMGGYPNYGYPPNYAYGMGQNMSMINGPIEATFKDGSTVTIPSQQQYQQPIGVYNPPMYNSYQQQDTAGYNSVNPANVSTEYIQGGSRINRGGYDPVSRTFSPQAATQGYNPFMGNTSVPITMQQNPANPNGFEPYDPAKRSNNIYYSSMNNGLNRFNFNSYYDPVTYSQNSYNFDLQEILYDNSISMDNSYFWNLMFGNKGEDTVHIIGYDYYGNPIYDNPKLAAEKQQEEYNTWRNTQIGVNVALTKIVAHNSGKKIDLDESKLRDFFDPMPKQSQLPVYQPRKIPKTPKEKEEAEIEAGMIIAAEACARVDMMERLRPQREAYEAYLHKLIKDSHDRSLGVEPGTNYDLKTYLDNAYNLRIQSAVRESKLRSKVGYDKYSTNNFRAHLANETRSPIPIESKDDEYVPIEQMIRNLYAKNKKTSLALENPNGVQPGTYINSRVPINAPPVSLVGATPQEPDIYSDESHNRFIQSMQRAKENNDIKLITRGAGQV